MTKTKISTTKKLTPILTVTVLVGAIYLLGPGIPINAEAVAVTEWLDCRPTSDINNPGFPLCDLQTGIALNNLVSAPPAGTLVVLEPDTFEHTSTWESAPSTDPLTLLPGPVTLNLLHVNLDENTGSNDICWSKHAILPDGSEIIIVQQHCFENPLPVAGFICPFGAFAPNIPAACIAAAGVASETVPSLIVAPIVLPAGTVIELNISCPGNSFLAVFFNNGIDVDGDGVLEFTTITEEHGVPPEPRTMGFWKNHPDDTTSLLTQSLGGFGISDFSTAESVFKAASAKNAYNMLAAQLLAAKLNVSAGAVSSCVTGTIADADNILNAAGYNGPGTTTAPQKGDKGAVNAIKNPLDDFNNNGCS